MKSSTLYRIKEAFKLIFTGKTTREEQLETDIMFISEVVYKETGVLIRIVEEDGVQVIDPHKCEGVTCMQCYKLGKA